ncbi:hypothetical protein FHG87_010986 [Trinorchestia longiramus]|nr:hypothetical protein FHG87_010986 [Trinorchestia longiramus]
MLRLSLALLAVILYEAGDVKGADNSQPTNRIFGWPLPSITASVVLGQTKTVTQTVQVPLYIVRTSTVYQGGATATVYKQGSTVYIPAPASTVYQQLVSTVTYGGQGQVVLVTKTERIPCGGGGRIPPGNVWTGTRTRTRTRTLTLTRTLTNVYPGSPNSPNYGQTISPNYLRTKIPG